ncbi:MAG: hypothetical protein NC818_00160 [Candidatus Omnitrophica bacterium]|nr:hypothetical protein [Candidatus Omnitrophota bacterium]
MLDYLGIFRELNKEKINYILVGGLAVNFWGIPRMTYDIDLLLYLEDKNLKRFFQLVKKWGFKPKAPVELEDFLDKKKRDFWIRDKNMKAFTLVNSRWAISEIDIIINTPLDYKKAIKKVKKFVLKTIPIPVISLEDLIKMKEGSTRLQDKNDVKNLKKILSKR